MEKISYTIIAMYPNDVVSGGSGGALVRIQCLFLRSLASSDLEDARIRLERFIIKQIAFFGVLPAFLSHTLAVISKVKARVQSSFYYSFLLCSKGERRFTYLPLMLGPYVSTGFTLHNLLFSFFQFQLINPSSLLLSHCLGRIRCLFRLLPLVDIRFLYFLLNNCNFLVFLLHFEQNLLILHRPPRAIDRITLILECQHKFSLPLWIQVLQLHIMERIILLLLPLLPGENMQVDHLLRKIQRDEVLYYMRRNRMHYYNYFASAAQRKSSTSLEITIPPSEAIIEAHKNK